MTNVRSAFAVLVLPILFTGCADAESLGLGSGGSSGTTGGAQQHQGGGSSEGGESANGGATSGSSDTNAAQSGGTSAASIGSTSTAKGGTTAATTPASTPATPSVCSGANNEVTLKHDAQLGGTLIGGTTIVTPAAGTTVVAGEIVLKCCFTVFGPSLATVSASDVTIYDANIQGQQYQTLKDTKPTVENPAENRYCVVFDVSTVAAAASMAATSITYNWRYETKNLGPGVMIDPTAGNEAYLMVTRAGNLAACMAVSL